MIELLAHTTNHHLSPRPVLTVSFQSLVVIDAGELPACQYRWRRTCAAGFLSSGEWRVRFYRLSGGQKQSVAVLGRECDATEREAS